MESSHNDPAVATAIEPKSKLIECLHRIDVHHHFAPPEFIKEVIALKTGQHALIEWTAARAIEEMDRASVATAVGSISPPGIWYGDNLAARRLARICNEYGARLAADYPGRFGLFAVLPLPDVDGSLLEIEYAFDVLKADGVGLMTSYGDKWLGDRAFAPVMAELNRRRAVVYTHPHAPACCRGLIADVPDHLIEFATDTTRAIASLLLSGTAARNRGIHFIFSHAGGTMPYLTERITWWADVNSGLTEAMPDGPLNELQRFFYDTAFSANPYALSCLLQLVSVSQVVYGSDYPFRTCTEHVAGLDAYGFDAAAWRAIDRDNALRLLPRLRRSPRVTAARDLST
jgi:predicted TIM-barrel fold metal-dependent hydrolase